MSVLGNVDLRTRPQRRPGVLKALRAGSFVGVHGGIATHVQLSLTAAGLPRPAIAGEEVRLAAGTKATLELQADSPGDRLEFAAEPTGSQST